MRKIFNTLVICGLLVSATSCKKYLDINTNPNSLTSSTPDLVLPQALATTAAVSRDFNTYGAWTGGMLVNAGGVSGFGSVITYNFNTSDYTNLWANSYDNINDYQYVLNKTTATGDLKNLNAIARTMKAFAFLRLVDAYGDVPYTQAFQGADNLTPAYDKAEDVYKACITELNAAITTFKLANTSTTVNAATTSSGGFKIDVTQASGTSTNPALSGGGLDMTNWIKFANTIKLRALIRIQKVASLSAFYATEAGKLENNFTTFDVLINPGYTAGVAGKTNPVWTSFAYTATGTNSTTSTIPSTFAVAFYNKSKLIDDGRGLISYKNYTANSQLGNQASTVPANPTGGVFFTGTGTTSGSGLGILKGPEMSQPIMLAAESYFLQAEAAMINLIPTPASVTGPTGTYSGVQQLFDLGILASFTYLDKDKTEVVSGTRTPGTINYQGTVVSTPNTTLPPAAAATLVYSGEIGAYKEANVAQLNNYLVNFGTSYLSTTTPAVTYIAPNPTATPAVVGRAAVPGVYATRVTTPAEQLEAIITQKYIAMNFVTADEAWNEYRRTKYPVSIVGGTPATTMVSVATLSSRSDKLAGRILYPNTEYTYNADNAPKGINTFTSLVFWDQRGN